MSFITLSHLAKSYGLVRAVDDFSLEIEKGQVVALVGPDGAGKTSTMRMICNLLQPDTGTITIDGYDVATHFAKLSAAIGYMPQSFSLYSDLSVEENLIFYAGLYGITGQRYREKRDYLYGFSNLKAFSKRRAGALSGGMKQKLALSCALIHEPRILVLDEPTTGVDPLSRRQFWEILAEFKSQGVTILLSTPYMDEVARADRACFVYGGRGLAEGTPAELTATFDGRIFHLDHLPSPDAIRQLEMMPNLRTQRFGSAIHLYTDRGGLTEVAGHLRNAGVDPSGLTATTPSLEDCFIQLMDRHSAEDMPRD